jgi:hypothetical protein
MAGAPGAACLRGLFEVAGAAPTCAAAGGRGPVVGAIGGLPAAIGIWLARGDRRLAGTLVALDDLRTDPPRFVRFAPRPDCPACARAPISPLATPLRVAEGR